MINNALCIQMLKDEIKKKGKLILTVHGDSMLPILKDGDVVQIEKADEYNIGDIVAYYDLFDSSLRIIVHRVIFVRKTYIMTKGDNNNFIDPLKVPIESIIGVKK